MLEIENFNAHICRNGKIRKWPSFLCSMCKPGEGMDIKIENRGIYLGRWAPLHKGHQRIIDKMISTHGIDNCLLIIGSSSNERTVKTPFTYFERRNFIKTLYPGIKIVGIPDVNDDTNWMTMLDDTVNSVFPNTIPIFYGGSRKDVEWYYDYGKQVEIINRDKMVISATMVRELMMLGEDISKFVDEKIARNVVELFKEILSEEI